MIRTFATILKHPPDHSGVWFAVLIGIFWILIALVGNWYSRRRADRG
jgi:hypothetical protein